jgi:hypothetical protein
MDTAAVEAFIALFEARRLPREHWTHQAHLVAGFWYAQRLGMPGALDEIRVRIRAHNESVGTPNSDDDGYHETITRLYMLAISDHVERHRQVPFTESLQALLSSPVAGRHWPFGYYSRERLLSVAARRAWLAPDLKETIP